MGGRWILGKSSNVIRQENGVNNWCSYLIRKVDEVVHNLGRLEK